jgi:thiol-disulfide isomerase/thioredoxin
LAEARGKVVLVDFWATFCKPCKELLREYQRWAEQLDGQLVVIAVSVDEPDDVTQERLQAFVDDLGLTFSVVWDRSQQTVARYDPPSMPTSYLVDTRGVLRQVYPGGTPDEVRRLREDAEALLRQPATR